MIDELIRRDRESPKRIAVVGDAMEDVWVHGHVTLSQEGCLCLNEERTVRTAGGAANAARQLQRWASGIRLYCLPERSTKTRFVGPDGRVVFRHDKDADNSSVDIPGCRRAALRAIQNECFDAVLISDYDKGFLDRGTLRAIINTCQSQEIPVVADAKRVPWLYEGALLKCNSDYATRWYESVSGHSPAAVVTYGASPPVILGESGTVDVGPAGCPVHCVNHVGAGDCFAAVLALALAHGLPLPEAARIAHAAGRVYVQHEHGRPPWPHEIRKDLDPAGGKALDRGHLDALRESKPGQVVVFTNGVFRLPHAGHAWLLRWAKAQGDVLVVGVNDDASAVRLRPGQTVRPLAERLEVLAGLECVDWIVPFGEDTPCAVVQALKPDVLVKGSDNAGLLVPGAEHAREVRFAPPGPHTHHATDLVESLRRG